MRKAHNLPVELSQYGSAMFVLNKGEAADHVIDTNLSVDGVGEGTVRLTAAPRAWVCQR